MKTKVEVYPATEQEGGGFWVCVCIHVSSYYKHMQKAVFIVWINRPLLMLPGMHSSIKSVQNVGMYFLRMAGMDWIHIGALIMRM